VARSTPPRPRKKATPSFDVPADVTAAPESGWVFRSDAEAKTLAGAPAAAATPPAPVTPPASAASVAPPAAAPAPAPPAPIVMVPVVQSEMPLRFVWVPLAIGYATLLAMLPRGRAGERS
jgi:hypothetical protein